MAGTFISFWNAAYVESPVLLNNEQKEAFWILVYFIEQELVEHPIIAEDHGGRALVSGAKSVQILNFAHLSDDATRHFRSVLKEWSSSEHSFWRSPIPWVDLGGFGVSFPSEPEPSVAETIAESARALGSMISQNLVCSDYN